MFTMNTRKKIIKTVYKDENDSDAESGAGDFSDSGSEAQISEHSTSAEEDLEDVSDASSGKEFNKKQNRKSSNARKPVKKKFAKEFLSKIKKQSPGSDNEQDESLPHFSVKDLTDADKLLPSFLNLSESDSSDDEASIPTRTKASIIPINSGQNLDADSENESQEKSDWTHHIQDNSEEIARKTFLELEKQKLRIEETKESLLKYSSKHDVEVSDVKDLLALGEEKAEQSRIPQTRKKNKNVKDDSESDMEDLEEVKEAKAIPQKGLQILVGIPDLVSRKTKKLDIEMMMKRKMNRVKKEHQVFMHKVHVLCWLGHGNYVSRVLNDQDILAAALSLVPSKECYPGERVDMKYVEQITTWFKDKLTLKQDKNEDKYRPKAPPLKEILLSQSKSRVCSTKKYIVFIFISMLRALGLQCRVMFNFVTLPLKPPASELCSLSIKPKEEPTNEKEIKDGTTRKKPVKRSTSTSKCNKKIPQIDGNYDSSDSSESDIMQVDGNNDAVGKTKTVRTRRSKKDETNENDDVSPPKRARKSPSPRPVKAQAKVSKNVEVNDHDDVSPPKRARRSPSRKPVKAEAKISKFDSEEGMNRISPQKRKRATHKTGTTISQDNKSSSIGESNVPKTSNRSRITSDKTKEVSPRKTRNAYKTNTASKNTETNLQNSSKYKQDSEAKSAKKDVPQILVTEENGPSTSKYFSTDKLPKKLSLNRTRSKTSAVDSKTDNIKAIKIPEQVTKTKARTKSAPGNVETSKYFDDTLNSSKSNIKQKRITKKPKAEDLVEDRKRVSHRDLAKSKTNPKNDVTGDLVEIVKARIKNAKEESKKGIVKGKIKAESDEDSDFIPEEVTKSTKSDSDDDFKPTKLSPKPRASTSRKIDRRVLSSDDDTAKNKIDVWCEVFVEELEQWIAVDVIRGKVHCSNEIYSRASHPVCYVVGWDNNNYLKDLTRRYVPHWNTVTRKQRAEASWWDTAVRPWRAPSTARDREEDEQLNRMQLEAPLPKSIAEYKNHPLYALKRHLLKFEALYPPDAQTLGFVRNEPVYARECVHVCRSRDTWLKEAKVVRMGEKPYKVVKARPKWDRLSNKLITDKPLEVFGPWQVQEYEPPVAEGGLVPRNAYGNVELFKPCMLPKGTVHIQLPGLNKVARKLNIDCAPAMTGFDFNGGWSHPVYDGFVVCEEFGEIITEAWHEDQVEQERKEIEKLETRVYGNWRRLIKGLFIRERLKAKYGFDNPTTSQDTKASKGPRLVVKKRN